MCVCMCVRVQVCVCMCACIGARAVFIRPHNIGIWDVVPTGEQGVGGGGVTLVPPRTCMYVFLCSRSPLRYNDIHD